ncbi:thioredoxin [Patescibacteria group bacterium]|nr:thioredoxin [Patescibacteria group bacterium]MBU0879829.1 thioredoxin [Patescibacteria group bacterium]MBU0880367.1 thioredoxin [Patescibacteria group bacterium]MBU0897979.1 thioredoxin [Patescibacteria group bacterium]MBU1062965.1 thioredoxin [Patescibacteria group bacterium]
MQFTDQNFQEEVENENNKVVLVDFSAPWCGPCRLLSPIIDELIEEYKNKDVKIGKVNIDESQNITEKYGIMSVPTIILFKNGKTVEQINGCCSKDVLIEVIDKHLKK